MPPSLNTDRRAFLGRVGIAATALAAGPSWAEASEAAMSETWDMSWVDKLAKAKYGAVFDVANVGTNAMNNAATILDQFHEVYKTADTDVRSVLVMRQLGTPLAFNDRMWDKYGLGEDTKTTDPKTKAAAKRNIYWPRYDASWQWADDSLEKLTERGTIVVLCNVAATNWSKRMAERRNEDWNVVFAEVKANLIPGTILVPSGIFALVRAQNAGAAYMRG